MSFRFGRRHNPGGTNSESRAATDLGSLGASTQRRLSSVVAAGIVALLAGSGILAASSAANAASIDDDFIVTTLVSPETFSPREMLDYMPGAGLYYSLAGDAIVNPSGLPSAGQVPVLMKVPVLGGTRVWEVMDGQFAGSCIDLPTQHGVPMVIVDCATAPKFTFKQIPNYENFWALYSEGRGYSDNFMFVNAVNTYTDNFGRLVGLTSPTVGLSSSGSHTDSNGNGGAEVGETVTFRFTVTNTGPSTLTNIVVTGSGLGTVTCAAPTLAPGAETQCTATPRALTQADIDAGSVTSSATVTAESLAGDVATAQSTATVALPTVGAIAIAKTGVLVDANGNGHADVGERAEYTITVSNPGSTVLTDITVTDDALGPIVCPTGPLQPGATITCDVTSITITQDHIDAGSITGTATATGIDTGGRTTTAASSHTLELDAVSAALTLKLTATLNDTNGTGMGEPGETVGYSYRVTNTGGTTLTALALSDTRGTVITCPTTQLAVGATVVCTAPASAISVQDGAAGTVVNTATARATSVADAVVTASDTATTPTTTAVVVAPTPRPTQPAAATPPSATTPPTATLARTGSSIPTTPLVLAMLAFLALGAATASIRARSARNTDD